MIIYCDQAYYNSYNHEEEINENDIESTWQILQRHLYCYYYRFDYDRTLNYLYIIIAADDKI